MSGTMIGVFQGDTRSVDDSSSEPIWVPDSKNLSP